MIPIRNLRMSSSLTPSHIARPTQFYSTGPDWFGDLSGLE